MQQLDAGTPTEDLHIEMREAADAGAAVTHFAGILLGVGDHFGDRLGREIFSCGDQERRENGEPRHRDHALLEIDRELLLEQHRRNCVGRDIAHHHRITVRLGACHFLDGENTERARFALDHELLAEEVTLLRKASGDFVVEEGAGYFAAIDPALTEELKREGLAPTACSISIFTAKRS